MENPIQHTMNLLAVKAYLLNIFDTQLDKTLFYHSKLHTLDVIHVAEQLCEAEQISPHDTFLIATAALFHDAGFLRTYAQHETMSCIIAQEILPIFKYEEADIERVCALIMATKIPQTPQDDLAKILCDADLDYLGRKDCPFIANLLFLELKTRGLIEDETAWNKIQVNFLKTHHYFTATSRRLREKNKQEYLRKVSKMASRKTIKKDA